MSRGLVSGREFDGEVCWGIEMGCGVMWMDMRFRVVVRSF